MDTQLGKLLLLKSGGETAGAGSWFWNSGSPKSLAVERVFSVFPLKTIFGPMETCHRYLQSIIWQERRWRRCCRCLYCRVPSAPKSPASSLTSRRALCGASTRSQASCLASNRQQNTQQRSKCHGPQALRRGGPADLPLGRSCTQLPAKDLFAVSTWENPKKQADTRHLKHRKRSWCVSFCTF